MRTSFVRIQSFIAITLAAVLAWGPPAFAASQLPELIAELKAKNPTLREARTRWEAAQARIPLSKGLPAPRIGVEFEEIPKGSVKLNQATLMYQLVQSLPFPGKLSARHRVAVAESQMAAAAFKQTEWEVVSDLKIAYYEIFLLDRELEIQREQVMWFEQAVTSAQARYATGEATFTELVGLQAQLLEAANAGQVLEHRREAMSAHLNHLLNRPVHASVGSPEPIALISLSLTPDELLLMADAAQPELLVVKSALERSDASWRLAKRELWPDLETMAELRDPAMGPIGPWDLTIALVLPFWFWTKLKYGVKAALYDKQSMEAAYEAMHNDITRRIHEHWHEALGAFSRAKLSQEGLLPLARQSVSSVAAAYQSGRGSAAELLDALRMLAERQRTYYQQLVTLEQHVVMLEQAAGVPLRASHAVPQRAMRKE